MKRRSPLTGNRTPLTVEEMMDIPIQEIIFYLFSLLMVGAAGGVITVRNPVYAALFLVLTFFSAAAIWMLLEAEFLAIVLVVVYVGAVMVLFLFVVMMLDINTAPLKEGFIRYLPIGLLVAVLMAAELLTVIWSRDRFGTDMYPDPVAHAQGFSNTAAVGERLYTQFLLPFEVAGIILLVAIVAAIALTLRKRPDVKTQNPVLQVRVKRDERVRLVKMDSESTENGNGRQGL
jgi:NADH-quinone oxidoreductase subunit J